MTTLRAEGLPSQFPKDVPAVALNAIGQMSSQTIINEVVMAEQFSWRRDRDWWRHVTGSAAPRVDAPSAGAEPIHLDAAPTLDRSDAVHAVFVPIDAANGLVAEAGYAFDPFVMRGLFTWGRMVAVRDLRGLNPEGEPEEGAPLAQRLGWGEEFAKEMADAAREHEKELKLLLNEYSEQKVQGSKLARFARGRERIAELPLCGSLNALDLSQVPAFFFPVGVR